MIPQASRTYELLSLLVRTTLGFGYQTKVKFTSYPAESPLTANVGGGLFTPENQIKTPSDLFSFSHIRNATRLEDSRLGALRSFSSSAQGIRATVGEQVDRWQSDNNLADEEEANNPEREAGVGPHPRIGIGLPMSNIFATCGLNLLDFDGQALHTFQGTNLEEIEV
ncbi:hypothetical protein H0H87_002602 [Tephrocybe sp. NHM501043]|nr:hypothetical protein H0H87_002602 [Tephrocybe sp. NHM501043]